MFRAHTINSYSFYAGRARNRELRGPLKAGVPLVLGLLLLQIISGTAAASAQTTNWVTVVSIKDVTGNQSILPTAQELAGHTYNATIDVSVPPGTTGSEFKVSLDVNVTSAGPQFWYLHTPGYAGYNRSLFTSSLKSVEFDWVPGTVSLSAVYTLPLNLTEVAAHGLTLHLSQGAFPLILVLPVPTQAGSPPVGTLVVPVVDQSIQTYLSDYQTASTLITSGRLSSSYSNLMQGVLALSQSLYQAGLTDQAAALIADVSPSVLPSPPSSSYVSYIIAAVLVLAVLAAALAILWLRGRGKSGFATGVISQANRELASLEVVAGRYDKALADQLKALREKLTEASD